MLVLTMFELQKEARARDRAWNGLAPSGRKGELSTVAALKMCASIKAQSNQRVK
jgi:hypothetical protein